MMVKKKLDGRIWKPALAEPGLTAGKLAGRQAGWLAGRQAGRQAGSPADKIWVRLEILKACCT